jgi:uncharacterized protein YprB with RNaseH-like and TPR domain
MKKDDIVWMSNHKCRHSHSFIEHPKCYEEEIGRKLKVGYIDIESSNLVANFGIMLCYCIKVEGEDTILYKTIDKKDIFSKDSPDKRVVKSCVEDMMKFDLLYGFYSTKFDIPFIRTRAIMTGVPFPGFGSIRHKDVYYMVRNKFRLHSNRLEVACQALLGTSDKSHLDGDIWRRAVQGDSEAMDYVLTHCKADVKDLEKLTHVVLDYVNGTTKSI